MSRSRMVVPVVLSPGTCPSPEPLGLTSPRCFCALVALVDDGLQHLAAGVGNAPGQEQIVELCSAQHNEESLLRGERRRPKEKCPKREGKCVNPGLGARSAHQTARIGAACSGLRSKSVNRLTWPSRAKEICQRCRG